MGDMPDVIRFDCKGNNAPAYSCSKPGDNSGEYVSKAEHDEVKNERDELRKGYALAADVTGYDGDWFDAAPIRDLISIKAESVPRELVEQLIVAIESNAHICDGRIDSAVQSIREHGK